MADKDSDRPENKTLSANLKKAAQIVTDEKSVTRMFGQELKSRIKLRDVIIYPFFGAVMAANAGMLAGAITYDATDHERPKQTGYSPMLGGSGMSFQALRAGGQTYLIVSDGIRTPGGDVTRHYGLYLYAGDKEFHYIQDTAEALGHFYKIEQALAAQKTAIAEGRRLSGAASVDFYSVGGLSLLHEEEKGSLERSYEEISINNVANDYYTQFVARTSTYVQEAMDGILSRHTYGDLTRELARTFESRDDYAREGRDAALLLTLAAMAGTPLVGAGLATRRRRKDGNKPS